MNAALNLDAVAGTSKGPGAGAVMHSAIGRTAAWMLEAGQKVGQPAGVRSGLATQSFPQSGGFQSKWELALRASGAGSAGTSKAGGTQEFEAVEIETASAMRGRANETSALFTAISGAGRLESTQPQIGATPSGGPRQPSIRTAENDGLELMAEKSSEVSNVAHGTRRAESKSRESNQQKPVANSPDTTAFAGPCGTGLPMAIAGPVAGRIHVPPAPAKSPIAAESRPWAGSSDLMAREKVDLDQTLDQPAVAQLGAARQNDAPHFPIPPGTGAAVPLQGRSLLNPDETQSAATGSVPHDTKAGRTLPTASIEPDLGRENSATVSLPAAGQREAIPPATMENRQIAGHAPVDAERSNRDELSGNVQGASIGAVRQIESVPLRSVELRSVDGADPGNSGGNRPATSETRNSRVPGSKAASAISSVKISAKQGASATPGAPAWAHIPENYQPAVVPKANAAGMEGRTPATAAREAFAALDMGTAVSVPRWVRAAGHQAEAGFEDPALGWVGVKADLSGGSVHASLVPATPEAGQVLGAHMMGLSTYLREEHSPVTSLSLANAAGNGAEQETGQAMQQGAGEGANGGRTSSRNSGETTVSPPPEPQARQAPNQGDRAGTIEWVLGSRGAQISVIA